jgi:cytochrome c peroxidase
MTAPKSSVEALNATQSQAKVLKLVVVSLFVVLVAGGIQAYRYFSATEAALTTEQITGLAKTTSPEDRAAWLRLARAVLAAESVQQITAPVEPRNNLGEASKVELGYQLFFDPILSNDKTTSCASCHHPDFGMADGLVKGVGAGGRGYGAHRAGTGPELARNTPSIFNVAFNEFQFWDGRVRSLEEQVLVPLFAENEMNQHDLAELLKRLRAIPQYRELFGKAFGFKTQNDGREINLQNIARAISAFERKLNITETSYDHFAKGKDDALTTEQLRGLVVFMGQGQCAVCHTPPNFHDSVLSSIGTTTSPDKNSPIDPDPGFGAVLRRQDGFGMFKTPGLRNVERTAPYMHNGAFKTLEEVVEFYNDGGGRGRGQEPYSQDSKVAKLDLTEQQKKDLVAFMKSLNDLSAPPAVPASVPSGLPVVGK